MRFCPNFPIKRSGSRWNHSHWLFPLLTILVFFTGCTHPAVIDPAETSILSQDGRFSKNGTTKMQNQWWTAFNDPQLDILVIDSLRNNPGIGQAWAKLRQAEASMQIVEAGSYPDLMLNGSVQKKFQNTPGSSGSTDSTSGSVSFTTSYELDLWGRVKSERDAAYFETLATEQDLQSAAISVAAQVTNTWFAFAEKKAQRTLLEAQYQNAQQTLELMQTRFENGNITGTDLLQQQQSVESRNASLILNQSEIEVIEHTLAILLGRDPSGESYNMGTHLSELPDFPELGIPAIVLHQRPDLQSAWLRVQAADSSVAASIANRFPKISIGGTLASTFGSPVNLFEEWIKTLVASLNLPVLDGGAKIADTHRKQAQLTAAVIQYQASFLNAIKEVEDAIVQEQQQLRYLDSLEKQIRLSEQVYQQTLNRFQSGSRSYLQVLTAQDSLHNLNRTLLTGKRTLLSYRINLYRAIGGAMDLPESRFFEHYSDFQL